MQVIELPRTILVQVTVDDMGFGVDPDGNYYRVENGQLNPVDVRTVAMEYLQKEMRIPDQFVGARDMIRRLLD